MSEPRDSNTSNATGRQSSSGDVDSPTSRLEKAVQELVSVAKEEFSDRAGAFVEETTQRLRRELGSQQGSQGSSGDHSKAEEPHRSRSSRRRARRAHRRTKYMRRGGVGNASSGRSRTLVRDTRHGKICGVCAGLANYWEMETWVVRCIAVTGLIFMPTIVLPAYFVACIIMKKDSAARTSDEGISLGSDHSTLAPEFGPLLAPRNSLRNIQAELDQAELRLRRMETHVTSGQYELQRELNKIETEA